MEGKTGRLDGAVQPNTYRQKHLVMRFAYVIVGMVVCALAVAIVMVVPDEWWGRGEARFLTLGFVGLSPILIMRLIDANGPRGPFRRLFFAPGTVTIDGSGIAWRLPIDGDGSAAWSEIDGVLDSRRVPHYAVVQIPGRRPAVSLPSVLVADGSSESRSIVDLVVAARPDRYERRTGLLGKACVLRPGVEGARPFARTS